MIQENVWKVQILVSEGKDFEISVIKKDNRFGQESWGWSGKNKLIIFDSMFVNNSGFNISEESDKKFMMEVANKLCEYLNKR